MLKNNRVPIETIRDRWSKGLIDQIAAAVNLDVDLKRPARRSENSGIEVNHIELTYGGGEALRYDRSLRVVSDVKGHGMSATGGAFADGMDVASTGNVPAGDDAAGSKGRSLEIAVNDAVLSRDRLGASQGQRNNNEMGG